MSDHREVYSSQTRQTRTALTLSSASLLLFSTIAKPVADPVRIAPGYFTIEPIWLWPLLACATAYFLYSFIVAALYDKSDGITPKSLKIVADAKLEYFHAMEQFKTLTDKTLADIRHQWYSHGKLFDGHNEQDFEKIKEQLQTRNVRTINTLDNLAALHKHFTNTASIDASVKRLRDDVDRSYSFIQKQFDKYGKMHERLEKSVTSISYLKNHFTEFLLPCIFAIGIIVLSFINRGVPFVREIF